MYNVHVHRYIKVFDIDIPIREEKVGRNRSFYLLYVLLDVVNCPDVK